MKKLLLPVFVMIGFFANSQVRNEKLDEFVDKWLGTKYRYGGRTEKGIDCSQFNKRLYKDVYDLNIQNTCRDQWKETKRVKRDSLQVGDLLFFNSKASPSGWHCSVYIGNDSFVHASNYRNGVKISSLKESMYKRIYKGAGRLD